MAQIHVTVELDANPDDTSNSLAQAGGELESELRAVSGRLPAPPQEKGAGEVVAGAIALITAADPAVLQAIVQTVVAFLRRNEGRRAHLKVGDVELAIGRPSDDEVAALIDVARSAAERVGR